MEIKINSEIRDYTESMFFGLSLRQFIFSVLACGIAVGIFFLLQPVLGVEITSWLCIVSAFPFAVLGFLKYNGMAAEQFFAAWIRSTFLIPRVLPLGDANYYKVMLDDDLPEVCRRNHFHRKGSRQKRKTIIKAASKPKRKKRKGR